MKYQCLGNFQLKQQRWLETFFSLRNPCWWLQLLPSGLNVSLIWFLNVLGIKFLNLNLLKVNQATIRDFCENPLRWRGLIFLWSKRWIIELQWTHKHFIQSFGNFNSKPLWWRVTVLCLINFWWWLQL